MSTAYVSIIGGNGQTTTTRDPFASPLQALITDVQGAAISGSTVIFAIPASQAGNVTAAFPNGSSVSTAVTNAQGVASSPTITAGTIIGTLTINVMCGAASPQSVKLAITYPPAASVTMVIGDGQKVGTGLQFGKHLQVKVLDHNGYPVLDGSQVTYTIHPDKSATFPGDKSTVEVAISPKGFATSPALTAGTSPATVSVSATVLKAPVKTPATFTETVE